MRQEGETQVLVTSMECNVSNPSISMAIEAGAHGELMAINSVNYIPPDMPQAIRWAIWSALSTNPEHLDKPPASIKEFMTSKALYAKDLVINRGDEFGESWAYNYTIRNSIVELYGLLRPRRQIWVIYAVFMTSPIWFGLEINYRPVKVDDVTLSEYNHRYGLYKRV